jgi:hypothetical protein
VIEPAIVLSATSLIASLYAIYVSRKNDRRVPDIVQPAPPVQIAQSIPTRLNCEPREKFLSKQDRREMIASKARDPEVINSNKTIRERLQKGSGLIAPFRHVRIEESDE